MFIELLLYSRYQAQHLIPVTAFKSCKNPMKWALMSSLVKDEDTDAERGSQYYAGMVIGTQIFVIQMSPCLSTQLPGLSHCLCCLAGMGNVSRRQDREGGWFSWRRVWKMFTGKVRFTWHLEGF